MSMNGLFRLAYALAVAFVFLMCVIFGTHAILDEDSSDYYRLALVIAGFAGIAGIVGGVASYRRWLPMAAGLTMGGLASLVWGWTEWEDGPDEVGDMLLFLLLLGGLALLLGGGYWFMRDNCNEPERPAKRADTAPQPPADA